MAYQIHEVKDGDIIEAQTTIEQDTQIKLNEENIEALANNKISEPENEGTAGQVLTTDGNGGRTWASVEGGSSVPVKDVQVDGTSVVQDGVANIPYATPTTPGIAKMAFQKGVTILSGYATVAKASESQVKEGTHQFRPITPNTQHESAFYGLAKVAGHDEASSTESLGTYTPEAKAAIQKMLGISDAYATKADTVLETSLSRGRKEGTEVGNGSIAFGTNVEASGLQSIAFGKNSVASESYTHAEGYGTTASGHGAHAEGDATTASGSYSHAEGAYTIASGKSSHVSGEYNIEDNVESWPEWVSGESYEVGDKVKVSSHDAYGEITSVKGYVCTTANSSTQFVKSNWDSNPRLNYAEIIGNGKSESSRSNAYTLDWDGNAWFAGNITLHDSTGDVTITAAQLRQLLAYC